MRKMASTQLATRTNEGWTPAPVSTRIVIPPITVPSQTATPDISE
jgi:hypothetical protein